MLSGIGNDKTHLEVTIDISQLEIIRNALKADPSYDESEHLLIGIIDDAIADHTSDQPQYEAYGFCY